MVFYGMQCFILADITWIMEEQLPTPLSEIIFLHLYLGSITFVVSVLVIIYLLGINKKLRILQFLINLFLYMILSGIGSFILWMFWPFTFDIMFGPINLPTLIISILVIFVLLKIQKLKFTKKGDAY